jgi:hypothetical protein
LEGLKKGKKRVKEGKKRVKRGPKRGAFMVHKKNTFILVKKRVKRGHFWGKKG